MIDITQEVRGKSAPFHKTPEDQGMTCPTRAAITTLSVADAMNRISNQEMTEMCLAVNMVKGKEAANRLLGLFGAARKQARESKSST